MLPIDLRRERPHKVSNLDRDPLEGDTGVVRVPAARERLDQRDLEGLGVFE